jgi:hypothetical protein
VNRRPAAPYLAAQRSHDERPMTWTQPTWLERNGERIVGVLGVAVWLFAVVMIVIGMAVIAR